MNFMMRSEHPLQNKKESQEDKEDISPSAIVEKIKELGQTNIPAMPDSNIHVLTIIGQVEGHMQLPPQNKTTKYEHILPQLIAIEQNPKIEGVIILLNTVGGDVEAGLALAEMIASMSKPTVSIVLGGGHSIGVPIAVAADHSYIASTATITIHPIRVTGLVIGVPQTFEELHQMQDQVIQYVIEHSSSAENDFEELMLAIAHLTRDLGTNLVGQQALQYQLLDPVGGGQGALENLNQ